MRLPFFKELLPYRYSSSSCWGNRLQKNAQGSVASNWSGIKFGKIVLQVNKHRSPFLIWCHTFKMAAMASLHVRPLLAAA